MYTYCMVGSSGRRSARLKTFPLPHSREAPMHRSGQTEMLAEHPADDAGAPPDLGEVRRIGMELLAEIGAAAPSVRSIGAVSRAPPIASAAATAAGKAMRATRRRSSSESGEAVVTRVPQSLASRSGDKTAGDTPAMDSRASRLLFFIGLTS